MSNRYSDDGEREKEREETTTYCHWLRIYITGREKERKERKITENNRKRRCVNDAVRGNETTLSSREGEKADKS